MSNKLDQIFEHSNTLEDFSAKYCTHLNNLMSGLDHKEIAKFIKLIIFARESKKQIFFLGNGGSAATASHFANDIAIGTRVPDKIPFKAISLTDNTAMITAIANDFGHENIFVKQLEILLNPKDIVVAISASGNSLNILKAIEFAKSLNCTTVGLTGFDGGKLKTMVDLNIHVNTQKGEYGPVEDIHMMIDHLLGAYLNRYVKVQTNKKNSIQTRPSLSEKLF